MIKEFLILNEAEKAEMLETPVLIMLLIAGADGEIEDKEKEWGEKISVLRAKKENSVLSEYYEEAAFNFKKNIKALTDTLPANTAERSNYLSARISRINGILPKIEKNFAREFYKDMLTFARQIAKASGGVFGIGSISTEEEEYLNLSMIKNPDAD